MPAKNHLLIGKLAEKAGVKPDTIRFYERAGLLAPPERTASDYRVYDEAALNRLRFIRKAQALGFSLDEIRRILALRGRGRATCECVVGIAEASLVEVDAKLRELQAFRDGLAKNLSRWRRIPAGDRVGEFCALIEATSEQTTRRGAAREKTTRG